MRPPLQPTSASPPLVDFSVDLVDTPPEHLSEPPTSVSISPLHVDTISDSHGIYGSSTDQSQDSAHLNHHDNGHYFSGFVDAHTEEDEHLDQDIPPEEADHDMQDVEEGGAPLNLITMDDLGETSSEAHSSPSIGSTSPQVDDFDHAEPANVFAPPPPPPAGAPFQMALAPTPTGPVFPDFQQYQEEENEADAQFLHPIALSNANPISLGPENPSLVQFLRLWRWEGLLRDGRPRNSGPVPDEAKTRELVDPEKCPTRIEYRDLKGDECDFQGIDWRGLGVTRRAARARRSLDFQNYVNRPHSDDWWYPDIPPSENYFRFSSMDIRRNVRLLHFQLRHIMGCISRTRVFYPGHNSVRELDPSTGRDKIAMRYSAHTQGNVSTLTAGEDILITGGFDGDYRYRYLGSEDKHCEQGKLTDHQSGITNHVQIHPSRRSSSPLAAFASNDFGFRIVDLATNTIIFDKMFDFALNCSALSPDQRLRVMVGDSQNVLITDAENGDILQSLGGHRDFGFSCDWAADGWTVATGNQDKCVRIWDARRWTTNQGEPVSVAVFKTKIAGARSLQFSPLGSGKKVLVAAEEADYINIIDAQMFEDHQTMDIIGELGGVSFANGGHELLALSSDRERGGILRMTRCDAGAEDTFDYSPIGPNDARWTVGYDWMDTPEQVVNRPGAWETLTQKRRRAALMNEEWMF